MSVDKHIYIGAYLKVLSFGKTKIEKYPDKCPNCSVSRRGNDKHCSNCGNKFEMIEEEKEIDFYEFYDDEDFTDNFFTPDLDCSETIILLNEQDDYINDEFEDNRIFNILDHMDDLDYHMQIQMSNFNLLIKKLKSHNIEYKVCYGIIECYN